MRAVVRGAQAKGLKSLKSLKNLNLWGAGKSRLFRFAGAGVNPHSLTRITLTPSLSLYAGRGGSSKAEVTLSDHCQPGPGSGSVEDWTIRPTCRPARERARRAGDRRWPAIAEASPAAA